MGGAPGLTAPPLMGADPGDLRGYDIGLAILSVAARRTGRSMM
jgi:hypothetical protein